MTPLRVALVGCGRMGAQHAQAVVRHPAMELVGCVDVVPERATRMGALHGAPATPQVPTADLAIVATPTATHRRVAEPLLAAGLWVLIEKPVGRSGSDALVHPRAVVGHCERFNPAVRAAKVEGLRRLTAQRLSPPTGRALDVDVIADLMIHDLDLLLHWTTGVRIDDVEVRGWRQRYPEWVAARFSFDGGTASLEASRIAKARVRILNVEDVHGSATVDLLSGQVRRSDREVATDKTDALSAQLDALADTIRGKPFTGASSADGRRAVELADAVRRRALA